MTEQQKAFNPDQAAMDAVLSIQAIMALGELGAQKSAQIQDIIADAIRAALTHAEGEAVAEVTTEPDYWSRGHFYEGRKKDIKIIKGLEDIPVGTKLYTHPAPQVAVPEGWRHALEEALAMMTSQSMTLERQADAVTGIRDLLAAAPTAPAGEPDENDDLVIRADAYRYACEDMERWQSERAEAGKEIGTEGSLVDGMAWLYSYIERLERLLAAPRPDGACPHGVHGVHECKQCADDVPVHIARAWVEREIAAMQQPVSDPDGPTLTWDKPMTSKQAGRYLLTNGFVAVELYRADVQRLEKRIEELESAAPDEQEIAVIRQLSETARNSDYEVKVVHDDYVDITRFETDIAEHIADWLDKQAEDRLRARKKME